LTVNKHKKLRVCLVASGGGHTSQLLRLAESWVGHETFYVTTVDVMRDKLSETRGVYVVGECNRQYPLRMLKVLLRCIRIAFRERPDVVISTGAAAGCMLCLLCKMLGAKVIWVDSITNVEQISLSGRIVRRIADLFLVQWPELASRYKKVEFVGTVV